MTAGYSARPLAAKIGVNEGQRVLLIGAPRDWSMEGIPATARLLRRRGTAVVDITIAFFTDAESLRREFPSLSKTMSPDGALWIAWPRRAGGHHSDLTDQVVRDAALAIGLVDVKVAAFDDDWSGLKTVWRKELRAGLRRGEQESQR